mmetsp:Transcript_16640/g.16561  ORF Transcript_16640/g.16561 Transcript_16640/m.16561 type:complete len:106 (+) Transcript_16640:115-432(+)
MQNLLSKSETNKVFKESQANYNQNLSKGHQQDSNCGMTSGSENGNCANENLESKEGFAQKCNYPQMNGKLADKITEKKNSTDEELKITEIEERKENTKAQKNVGD